MYARISASLWISGPGANSCPRVMFAMLANASRIRFTAATATCASASAGSVSHAMSITGGVEISALAIVTLPRKTGAERAASMRARSFPFGVMLVPVAYSISCQSEGSRSSAAIAVRVKFLWRIFPNAIIPLNELNGPDASSKSWDVASGMFCSLLIR